MKITIDFIPHLEQRYNTCGDWVFDQVGDLSIHVSETGNWRWNVCVALHELVEALTCKADGVTTEEVDAFDVNWKPFESFEEPGEDPRAPYFEQHSVASFHEQQLFDFMFPTEENGWEDYEAKLEELQKSRE